LDLERDSRRLYSPWSSILKFIHARKSARQTYDAQRSLLIKLAGIADRIETLSEEELVDLKTILDLIRDSKLAVNDPDNRKLYSEIKQLALDIDETIKIMRHPTLASDILQSASIAEAEYKEGKTHNLADLFE
jgi:hypothetical protein